MGELCELCQSVFSMHYLLKENTEEDYSEGVQHALLDSYYNQDHRTEAEQQVYTIGDSNNEAELLMQEEEQQTSMKYNYCIA